MLPLLQARVGYGQFINHNHFAFLMEMTGGLLCGLIVSREMSRARVLYYLLAGLVIWSALVLSNSRGGIFSMLCQVLFVALIYKVGRASQPAVTIRQRDSAHQNLGCR